MKKIIFTIIFLFLFISASIYSQTYKIQEGFETCDSTHLPDGWKRWNLASFPIADSMANWTVRDSGSVLPGINTSLSQVHTGIKSCMVTWWTGLDTSNGYHIANAWLVTKKIHVNTGDSLKFWACGGSPSWTDSMQIWIGVDSIPPFSSFQLATLVWPKGSIYGNFTQYRYSLSTYNNLDVWIGFYYCTDMNVSVNGYVVFLDDVVVVNPIGIHQINSNIPRTYQLYQNYPNPFNPTTTFKFDLPKKGIVNIVIFNTLGQDVKTLLNEVKDAGSYQYDFDATGLASGTYFYKITAGDFVKTNKMVLVK